VSRASLCRARLRGVLTLAIAVATVTGVTAAARAVAPRVQTHDPAPALAVAATTPVLVCPGPQTLAVPAGGTPVVPPGPVVVDTLALTGAGAAATVGDLVPSSTGSLPAPGSPHPLTAGPDAALDARARTAAGAVRLDARTSAQDRQVPAAALQYTLATSGDLRGLEATSCGGASGEAWLVGGGTGTGQRDRLLLANPTSSPALLDLTVHGPGGPVKAPGAEGILVPSGRQVAVFVDALAPNVGAIAVHVVARSGRVVASLHHTVLRGFTAGGVDDVSPAAAPARAQVLPGIVLAAHGRAAVRLAVPGQAEGVVRVHLVGEKGVMPVARGVVEVPAGAVRDIDLTGVAAGTYTAVAEADVPVVAGALVSRSVDGGEVAGTSQAVGRTVPPSELAWVTATQPLRGSTLVALPRSPAGQQGTETTGTAGTTGPTDSPKEGRSAPPAITARLVLAVSGTASAPIEVAVRRIGPTGVAGPERAVEVSVDRCAVVPLDAGAVGLLVRAPASRLAVHAALVLDSQDAAGPMVSVVPVLPGPPVPGPPPRVVEDDRVGLR